MNVKEDQIRTYAGVLNAAAKVHHAFAGMIDGNYVNKNGDMYRSAAGYVQSEYTYEELESFVVGYQDLLRTKIDTSIRSRAPQCSPESTIEMLLYSIIDLGYISPADIYELATDIWIKTEIAGGSASIELQNGWVFDYAKQIVRILGGGDNNKKQIEEIDL